MKSIYHSIVRTEKSFSSAAKGEKWFIQMGILRADCVTFDLIKGQIPRFYSHYLIYNLHVFAPYHQNFLYFLPPLFLPFQYWFYFPFLFFSLVFFPVKWKILAPFHFDAQWIFVVFNRAIFLSVDFQQKFLRFDWIATSIRFRFFAQMKGMCIDFLHLTNKEKFVRIDRNSRLMTILSSPAAPQPNRIGNGMKI